MYTGNGLTKHHLRGSRNLGNQDNEQGVGCTAAPMAKGRVVDIFTSIFFSKAERPMDTRDMDSTVHPDKKLTSETLITPVASRIVLINTPPPIPQIEPAMDAKKLTIKNTNIIISHSFPFPLTVFPKSCCPTLNTLLI